ncbi:MAG: hypothetical protein A2521_10725 [Deltaproteobacteria bacterium RIFOXYD12_FULL_57_12]|nr:MAG: hypothetical protein A2521_10725 [Deltaproteobacteria bacterium RIFOXYD12_FULL_57_12]
MADRGAATQLRSCTITRIATIEQVSRTCPGGEPPDGVTGRCGQANAVCTYQAVDYINDLCAASASDPGCTLQEEEVDAVQTFRNFQSTGLVPLPSSRSFTIASDCNAGDPPHTTVVTRDWWRKERTYRCTGSNRFDFTDTAQRVNTITGSVDANGLDQNRFAYADTRKNQDTGAWSTDSHVLETDNTGDSPACEQVCKTRKTVQDTQVAPAGVTTDTRTTDQSVDYLYRVCDGNNTCPAGPGETVVKGCQCLDEFAEAASIMSVLNEAGKDMICSDGVRK